MRKCLTSAQQKGASMRARGIPYRGGYTREEEALLRKKGLPLGANPHDAPAEPKPTESCNECGRSVAWGSGRFVNRIPDSRSVADRKEAGCPHPEGDYLCAECEEKFDKEGE